MTIKQKQCILAYFDCYDGKVDGVWGTKSAEGTIKLQRKLGMNPDGVFGDKTEAAAREAIAKGVELKEPAQASNWWDDIKYFKRAEFACHCNGKYCNGFTAEPQRKLVTVADRVRDHFDAPATVSSGVRCSRHNANVGGVSNSRHLEGKAMDFAIRGKTSAQVLAYVQKQPEIRYAYAIDGSYVHMDIL